MGIPVEIRKIDLLHKDFIDGVRLKYGHTLSSHAFVSLYLWQHAMNLSLLCNDDFFAVKCGAEKLNNWFFPCGNTQKIYDFISGKILDESFSLCFLRDCDVNWLDENFPDKWSFRRVESSDEYICNISEYVSLKGSKFSEIRRKIRKIDKEYDIKVREISDDTLNDAMYVADKWYEEVHNIAENGLSDDMIAEIALNKKEELDISGIVLYADNIPSCIFAGFPLTEDTVDVLIGKCTPNAPKGAVYYALREYLKFSGSEYVYCNHEEDLGIEGIRQVKNSLCPISKTHIWEAVLNEKNGLFHT